MLNFWQLCQCLSVLHNYFLMVHKQNYFQIYI